MKSSFSYLMTAFAATSMALGCGAAPSREAAPSDGTEERGDDARVVLDLLGYVDPFIGTAPALESGGVAGGRGGAVFPGAVAPFGMMQWSPDTPNSEPRGTYGHRDDTITGFSLTHFSGAGCASNAELPVTPALPGQAPAPLAFSHDHEEASPGYYSVVFANGIRTELTTTQRAGVGRFSFPGPGAGVLKINARSTAENQSAVAEVFAPDAQTLRGVVTGGLFCGSGNEYKLYFHMTFSRPFVQSGEVAIPVLEFADGPEPVLMRAGLSYVSMDNARLNLEHELGTDGFDQVRARTETSWNDHLNSVQVTSSSVSDKTKFYTALYRSLLHPNVFSDVNGEYLGFDDQIHHAAGYVQYANISGWDTYRSQAPLLAFLFPGVASDMMRSMVASGQQCGALPKWTQNNTETGTMVGDPGSIIVASSYAFGARDFDHAAALQLMLQTSFVPGTACQGWPPLKGLAQYLGFGYLAGAEWGSASTTLEYATRDFAVAQFAEALGDTASHRILMARTRYWRNVLHPELLTIQQRVPDGAWQLPLNGPGEGFYEEYVEGNSEQYTWFLPYDAEGLFRKNGGVEASVARLDSFFTELNAGLHEPNFYMGNQPSFATPWLYNWARVPSRTQSVVRRIVDEVFKVTPDGLPGNDDLGAMSSWLVWAMLGLYPQLPGVDGLTLAAPYFSDVTIHREGGGTVRIVAHGAPHRYIESVELNGHALDLPWFRLGQVDSDWTLELELTEAPSSWGTGAAVPPSHGAGEFGSFDDARNHRAVGTEGAGFPAGADGFGFNFPRDALAAAGLAAGATVTSGGISYTWPAGPLHAVIAQGQRIRLEEPVRGSRLGFLAASTVGPATGTFILEYADGSRAPVSLTFGDWTLNGATSPVPASNQVVAQLAYRNTATGGRDNVATYVFAVTTPLRTDVDLTAIVLPDQIDRGRIQLFSMGIQP